MVQIELDTITRKDNSIFGVFYFENEEFTFPEKNWNDFIIVVLSWWTCSFHNLLNNKSIIEELSFMDGPYNVKASYIDEDFFHLTFIDQDRVLYVTKVKTKDFITDFLRKINSVIRCINKMNLNNDDIAQLQNNYSLLQKTAIRFL